MSFPYTPVIPAGRRPKTPAWLNDVTLYHNRGDTTFTGEDSLYGDFFGLDDLFTEHPRVVDGHDRHLRGVGPGLRHRRLPHRHDEARQRRVLAAASAPRCSTTRARRASRSSSCSARWRTRRKHFTSHFTTHGPDAVHPGLPVPGGRAGLRGELGARPSAWPTSSPTTTGTRTPTPTPTSCRRSSATTTWAASAASSASPTRARPTHELLRPRPARARAHVLLARQPGRLLRRRAGLHRRRRRPARPPGHVPEPGRRVQRRRPDRHGRDHRAGRTSTARIRSTAASRGSPR